MTIFARQGNADEVDEGAKSMNAAELLDLKTNVDKDEDDDDNVSENSDDENYDTQGAVTS